MEETNVDSRLRETIASLRETRFPSARKQEQRREFRTAQLDAQQPNPGDDKDTGS